MPNPTQMSDASKMMLFMFLGLIFAIMMLGFHRSPAPTTAVQRAAAKRAGTNQLTSSSTQKIEDSYQPRDY